MFLYNKYLMPPIIYIYLFQKGIAKMFPSGYFGIQIIVMCQIQHISTFFGVSSNFEYKCLVKALCTIFNSHILHIQLKILHTFCPEDEAGPHTQRR